MVIGETLTEPSVNDGTSSAGGWYAAVPGFPTPSSSDAPSARWTPMLTAVRTTLHSPTFCSSSAKNTLIDCVVPVYSVYVPCPGPSALLTGNGPVGCPRQS